MKKFADCFNNCNLFIVIIITWGSSLSLSAQCPTVTDPIQSFCDTESLLISDLSATDNGNGVVWYESATSTTPLSNSEGLVDGEDYFADDNSGSCGSRERVEVVIYGPPVALSIQGICVDDPNDATISDLVAIGNDVQWYDSPSSITPLADTTVLVDGNDYYADQANPDSGCRTSRSQVRVSVILLNAPTGPPVQDFCDDFDNPPTIADLVASGTNNWYASISSGVILDPTTPLIDGEDYYATTVEAPCESTDRLRVIVNLFPDNDAGESATVEICESDVLTIGTIRLKDELGGTPENNGSWSGPLPTSGGPNGIVDITSMTVAGSPYVFTYTVDNSSVCSANSSTVTIIISPEPNAGSDGSLDLCANDTPVDLFDSLGGTPDTGGTWSPALASGTGIFDPTLDTPGTYTYTVSSTVCGDASASVTVTITPEPDAGSDGSLDLCANDAAVDLFDSLGGTPDTGGTWSPTLASGTGVFDPALDAPGTYTYTVSTLCGDASASVTVTITPEPDAGSDGSIDLCNNDIPVDLFDSLGGTPETGGTWSPALASATGVFDPALDTAGIYTYTVSSTACGEASASVTVTITPEPDAGSDGSLDLCATDAPVDLFDSLGGTPDTGGIWSPALASGTGVFDPTLDAAGIYTYTVSSTACGDASASVTVTITPEPDAGSDGSIDLCATDALVDLFDSLGGTPDTGGTWSPALTSGTGVFDPTLDAAGIYTYTVSSSLCGDASASVTVTIIPEPDAGSDGLLDLCANDTPVDLFDSLGGTPDTGGTWSPALTSGTGVFDPTLDTPGTYTYTVTNTTCNQSNSASVTISIESTPDVNGMSLSANNICLGESVEVFISGATQLTDEDYTILYALSGSNITQNTVVVTIMNGAGSFIVPSDELTEAGVTVVRINGFSFEGSFCNANTNSIPVVRFIITETPEPELVEGGDVFCALDGNTVSDLDSSIVGSNSVIWYDAPTGGNAYNDTDLLVEGATYYASVTSAEGCESILRAVVTVLIGDCENGLIIPDGFSPNGDGINDTFVIKNLRELYPNFHLKIFNRYGNILYEGGNNTPDWDGKSQKGNFSNSVLPVGVYFFILEFNDGSTKPIQDRVYLGR